MNATETDITDGIAIVASRVTIGLMKGIAPNRIAALMRKGISESNADGAETLSAEMCERITAVCVREVKGSPQFQPPTH